MKRILLYTSLYSILSLGMAACSNNDLDNIATINAGQKEIVIRPVIGTSSRASGTGMDNNITQDKDLISGFNARTKFEKSDLFVLTKICRTNNSLPGFTYYDKQYHCNESGGWMPDYTEPAKLYWTDTKEHTFIGYAVPTLKEGSFVFAPKENEKNGKKGLVSYYGVLPSVQTDSTKLKEADLLLTYNDQLSADLSTDMVAAILPMHHAMAKVKIILNINGFAYSKEADEDIKTEVDNIQLTDQPLNFVWDQTSAAVKATDDATKGSVEAWKAVTMGTENQKQFIAYALVVPGENRSFKLRLSVTYNDLTSSIERTSGGPKYNTITQYYDAKFNNINFKAGQRTTLYVTLTHENERMLIDATYNDWVEVDLNDRSELQKKSIFMPDLNDSSIKLGAEAGNTNIEKCNWLYTAKITEDNVKIIKDCYGNDGTQENPYLIKYAQELLAFKKEVENGRTFEGQYIKLYTDIYLQPSNTKEELSWEGIGNENYMFNGNFEGNYSAFRSLIGAPLFNKLGSKATVQHLTVQTFDARKLTENESYATKGAILCGINNGTISGCSVLGTVKGTKSGGIASENTTSGKIYACYHHGEIIGTDAAGGIVAENAGTVSRCYQANGNVSGDKVGGIAASNTGTIGYCYYDTYCAPNITAIAGETDSEKIEGAKGYHMDEIKKNGWCDKTLNSGINEVTDIDVHFIQNPGDYPTLEPKTK